ncbi:MAG: DUF881 domain-containing protein [Actinomycetota bacterium]|nr:DUF881 domain-containing protein [Actinomycetota bacterium]
MPEPARSRLARAFFARPGRGQLVVAVLLALVGFSAALQIRLTNTDGDFSGQRRQDLVALLDSLSSATDRSESRIDELEETRDELLTSSQRRQAALEQGRSELDVLAILSGTVAATGPGITVTVTDPDGSVLAASMLNGIEELRDAGAEAIEVNDQVRVVASTSFTEVGDQIVVDDVTLRPPYVIDAIGSPQTLSEAMVFPGGFSDEVEELGGAVSVEQLDVVRVDSLHKVEEPEYSQPTDR